jgi:PAS domain S-box-containing protein
VLLLGASIDETRHAEQAVRESEERMSFAAASANVCMWSFDRKADRFWTTDHGRQMLGFQAHLPLTRHSILDAIHSEDRQAAIETMRATMQAGTLADWEFRVVRPDGELRWLRCRARSHGDFEGRAAHVTGTFSDITEQREAELEVARQRQELAHMMRVSLLGELAGGIAHELTQPLSAILSNAEAARIHADRASIESDSPDLEEIALILDDIIEEGNRAGEVIHRLRGMLKKSEARFEVVDMNDLAASTLRLLHNELITRRVRTVLDFARDLPLVSGDPVQLQQVLLNLAMNAMDAMNEVAHPERKIMISTQATAEGSVEVSVADRGIGLNDGDRERVFNPFYTTKERGLGLGLSLCSSIIKLHGGELRLANNPTGGATATFRLPGPDTAATAK